MTRLDWFVAVTPFVVLAGIAVCAVRAQRRRLYRCRARGCDRTFADPLERSSHYRKAHLA